MSKLLSPLNKLGFHTMDLVMTFQVAMRFLPLLAQSAERVAKAQASRGAEWGTKAGLITQVKRVIPLIVPLMLISLRRAETMALAMDARAYGINDHRTSMYELKFTWKDGVILLVGAVILTIVIL
jgi:energy-coupling factor transport system permease protein